MDLTVYCRDGEAETEDVWEDVLGYTILTGGVLKIDRKNSQLIYAPGYWFYMVVETTPPAAEDATDEH